MTTTLRSKELTALLVEDHGLVRHGLALALKSKGVRIVAEADTAQGAVEEARKHKPEVVLMDIGLPDKSGVQAVADIKRESPDSHVIMLTSHQDEQEVLSSLSVGADAFCIKDIQVDLLHDVMMMVRNGAVWLDPAVGRKVISNLPERRKKSFGDPNRRKAYNMDLTRREREVLGLLVDGRSNKEIARLLGITIHTAKCHVCNIIQKLSVEDRTQAAVKAVQECLV